MGQFFYTAIRQSILALLVWVGPGTTLAAAAERAWISDSLTVPVRSGPSTGHRILHRGLPSGTELEILTRDEDSGFVQIRSTRGTEGWMPDQYLVTEPIARDRLVVANREIRNLRETLDKQRTQLSTLNQSNTSSSADNSKLRQQVVALTQELAEIKKVSASALELAENNVSLTELNNRLRAEVDELVATISQLQSNVQERWLIIGGGLVLAGLLGGVAIKSRPRRSAWS